MISKVKNLCDPASASYTRKWVILSMLIGIVAGLGSIIFYWSLTTATHLLLGRGAGYVPPASTEKGRPYLSVWLGPGSSHYSRLQGGLLSGIIVFRFAPEAEGHGTDAAINAFHNKGGVIRRRVPVVKAVASAITIGSGRQCW